MVNKNFYRKQIEVIIRQDPIIFIVEREIHKEDGFGGYVVDKTSLNISGRLYNKTSFREVYADFGITIPNRTMMADTKLLLAYDSPLEERDVFSALGRTFIVGFINNYLDICKIAELKVIDNDL